jgi:hypothetical protein
VHLLLQVRVRCPQSQQSTLSVDPAGHSPWPVHADHAPHWQLEPQVRE